MKTISSGGIVFKVDKDKEVKVLLLKKNEEYLFPKGRSEEGETLEITAIREIKEESYVDVKNAINLGNIGTYSYYSKMSSEDKEVHMYLFVLTNEQEIIPLYSEGFTDGVWMSFKEASNMITYESSNDLLNKAYEMYIEKMHII